MAAFVYDAANQHVVTSQTAVRRANRGRRTAVSRNAAGTAAARTPSCSQAIRATSATFCPRSPKGFTRSPRNCSASTMYQKPSHVSGCPYTSGAPMAARIGSCR